MKRIKYIILLMIFSSQLFAQAETEIEFFVNDGTLGFETLVVGRDTAATSGIDVEFSESELPPQPPSGIFDTRLILPNELPSLVDIRPAENNFGSGTEFEMIWQLSQGSNEFNLSWFLPEGIVMTIKDFYGGAYIEETFTAGESSYTITNEEVNGIKVILKDETILNVIENETTTEFILEQNYPNPFNPTTTIKFTIPSVETPYRASLQTMLIVYDILGREVKTLLNKPMQPGTYEVEFNGSSLPSGVYLYRIKAGSFVQTKKMILVN
jgi:hypothetical protein